MKESGWDVKVRNVVFMYLMKQTPTPHPITPLDTLKEPMAFIRNAQVCHTLSPNVTSQLKAMNTVCFMINCSFGSFKNTICFIKTFFFWHF